MERNFENSVVSTSVGRKALKGMGSYIICRAQGNMEVWGPLLKNY